MKKNILVIAIMVIVGFIFLVVPSHGTVKGITSSNYASYVKPNADAYGYNIGECNRKYLAGEEYFYNEYYDHWNVDKVYDASKLTDKKLAIAYAKANYPKCKIKFVTLTSDKDWKKILKRKGKNIVYIEKCTTKSSGKKYGYTIKGHYYVAYNKKVKKNKKVTSYFIWNPNTNYEDDVVAAVDNKMIR